MSQQNNGEKRQGTTAPPRMGGRGPGGPGAMDVGQKAKDFKGSGGRLLSALKPYRKLLVIVVVFAIFSTLFMIVGPKIMALATDELASGMVRMITGVEGGINFEYIAKILIGLGAIYLAAMAFSYLQSYLMAKVSVRISYKMRNDVEGKINRLPLSYFHRASHGDVLSRITNDVDTLNQNLSQGVTQFITSVCTILGVIIMMVTISWQMTLVTLCIIPVSLVFVIGIVKASQKYFKGQQKYLGTVNGQVEEMYGGHLIVKAFGKEEEAVKNFEVENDKLYEVGWKAQFISGVIQPIMNFVGNLGYVVVCIVGAYLASGGSLTIGGIQAFIQYVRNFTQPITQLATISSQIQSTVAASERIFEFLDEEEESREKPLLKTSELDLQGNIRFDHVRFGYEDTEEIIIHNFSVDVKTGQTVAIVGPTGAGKTTIVKLLMRFHELQGGSIQVDDYDITQFERSDIRSQFGMVLQDAWLYNGTIMENIRYGRLEATDEEVIEAAKMAQADRFIRTLPGGYQMELNEEANNVSQGQKQLLTIARAILADSKIMILDEATSSVDTRTEVLIQKAMNNLTSGRTSFVIAHRLSTIRNADMILCMDEGDIVEQGSHEELMELNGFYTKLYNSQFEQAS